MRGAFLIVRRFLRKRLAPRAGPCSACLERIVRLERRERRYYSELATGEAFSGPHAVDAEGM